MVVAELWQILEPSATNISLALSLLTLFVADVADSFN